MFLFILKIDGIRLQWWLYICSLLHNRCVDALLDYDYQLIRDDNNNDDDEEGEDIYPTT